MKSDTDPPIGACYSSPDPVRVTPLLEGPMAIKNCKAGIHSCFGRHRISVAGCGARATARADAAHRYALEHGR